MLIWKYIPCEAEWENHKSGHTVQKTKHKNIDTLSDCGPPDRSGPKRMVPMQSWIKISKIWIFGSNLYWNHEWKFRRFRFLNQICIEIMNKVFWRFGFLDQIYIEIMNKNFENLDFLREVSDPSTRLIQHIQIWKVPPNPLPIQISDPLNLAGGSLWHNNFEPQLGCGPLENCPSGWKRMVPMRGKMQSELEEPTTFWKKMYPDVSSYFVTFPT